VDDGGGWLIFSSPPIELALHPGPVWERTEGRPQALPHVRRHRAPLGDLREKWVEFAGPIEDEEFGRLDRMKVPNTGEIGLYRPDARGPARPLACSSAPRDKLR
jgi:hypothetical protein